MFKNLAYFLILTTSRVCCLLPKDLVVLPLSGIFRFGYWCIPRMQKVALKNLEIAFPDKDSNWHHQVLRENATVMAQFVVDALTLPLVNLNWIKQHVIFENQQEFLNDVQQGGVLMVGSHLGSFELLPSILSLLGVDLTIVVRPFKFGAIDEAWKAIRETHGVATIDRKNGIRKFRQLLKEGRSVGILCDQNVTKANATFPVWFSRPAATSKAPALLGLNTDCKIWAMCIRKRGRNYEISAAKIDHETIKLDPSLTKIEKIESITQLIADSLVEQIRSMPEGWFWIHRRWKTRPGDEPETIYSENSPSLNSGASV
jgi:KDO2-lipid IV(A) lauroyltransferase